MKGGPVPRHFALTMTPDEAGTVRRVIEDALELSHDQAAKGRDDWLLSDREEEVLTELAALLGA